LSGNFFFNLFIIYSPCNHFVLLLSILYHKKLPNIYKFINNDLIIKLFITVIWQPVANDLQLFLLFFIYYIGELYDKILFQAEALKTSTNGG